VKLVLDTNIVVSAALGNAEDFDLIARLERDPAATLYVTEDILDEYDGALRRKVPRAAEAFLARIKAKAAIVEPAPGVEFPPDPTDAKFIACALSAGADVVVTKDKTLKREGRRRFRLTISRPSEID